MNSKANYELFYEVRSNDETIQYPPDGDFATYDKTASLESTNDQGDAIFHRFKIKVFSSCGIPAEEDGLLVL